MNPVIYGKVIDSITNGEKKIFQICLVIFLITQLLVHVLSILENYIGQLTVTLLENELKKGLFEKIIHFKSSVLDGFMEGELFNRLEFDAEAIVDYYIDIITNSIMIICNFVISLYFIIHISKQLTVLAVIMLPILYFVNYISRNRIRILQELRKAFDDKYYTFVSELMGSIRGIKIFQLEKAYVKKYHDLLQEKYEIEKKNVVFSGAISLFRGGISNLIDILIVYVSAMIIFHGGMSIGSMVAFNTYLGKLFEAVNKVLDINMNKHSMEVNYSRIMDLRKKEVEKQENSTNILTRIKRVKVEDVCFSYEKDMVLKGISFEISKPGIYTIVGENGSGKSTLFKLLEALYPCNKGKILINAIPIEEYEIKEIRSQISYLTKEPFLINGTIEENIKIGEKEISFCRIEEVCKMVGLHEDIMEFESGYDTEIGEFGCKLSSGQKQKIGLARMLLQNRSFILLDEATSALDSASRKKVDCILEELKKTTIIMNISHNEWEIENSEHIFVFHKGRIVDEGNHTMLKANSKIYNDYFKIRQKEKKH